ncbi:MAG: signal peptide peptidase SppA [Rhodospirillales bacterium]|nr:signal peptide peptidase SppA [Rhodospirillales bacterium]
MALEADRYFDRRRLKRRLTFWRVVAVIAAIGAVAVGIGRFGVVPRGDAVAVLDIGGVIFDDADRNDTLRDISKNSHIKALIVRINSPGGTVVGGESLFQNLRRVAKNKPVVAVLGEIATSGGYMAALGSDYIVGRQSTVTGSIGVLMQSTEITGLLDKLGVKAEMIKSSPLKAQPNPLEPLGPKARAVMDAVIADMHGMFVDMVAERRKMDRDRALKLSDGRIYTGRQARENGLIDAIGSIETARTWLATNKNISAKLPQRQVRVRHKDGVIREILDDLVGKTLFSERLRLDGLISLWHPGLR